LIEKNTPKSSQYEDASVASAMAEVVIKILQNKKHPIGALLMTGGDTALSICEALNAKGIALMGELMPGVPAGRILGGEAEGLAVITKSGAFGDEMAIVHAANKAEIFFGFS
jgi:uncharacterized protein YgbK (DUF1537 family)